MGRGFDIIPSDLREKIQKNVGVLLSSYDLTNPYDKPNDSDIIASTTGGITATCTPRMTDFFEDVDGAPNGTMEGQDIDGYDCSMSFSSITFNADSIAWSIGSATVTTLSNGIKKIVPSKDIAMTDFKEVWWVTNMLNGGAIAVRLRNAYSTGGMSLQTTKNGKGQAQQTLTGFISAADLDSMPMEYYVIPPQEGTVQGAIELNHHTLSLTEGDTATLVATKYPATATVTWTTSSASIATVSNGVVTAVAEGDAIITAQISVDNVEFVDTCTIIVTADESE